MFDHRGGSPKAPPVERGKLVRVLARETGDDTLVWMYERLTHPDRRRFFQLKTPGERLLFLVDGGSHDRRQGGRL